MVTFATFAVRGMTDAFMVGRLGTVPLAAIMPAQQVLFVIVCFGQGLAAALNACASQRMERFGNVEAGVYCWQAIWLALGFGSLASSIYFVAPELMGLFGHPFEVFQLETGYLRIAIWSVVPQFIAIAISNYLFAIRRSEIAMWLAVSHVLANVMASRVLIFGIGDSIPGLGMNGAAYGAVIASWLLLFGLLILFLASKLTAAYRPRRPTFSFARIRHLLSIGLYNGVIDVVDILFWNIAIVYLIGQLGTAHLAAATVMVAALDLLIFPVYGIFAALTTVVGACAGARRFKEASRIVWTTLLASASITVLIAVGISLASPVVYELISGDPLVTSIGRKAMWLLPFIILFSTSFYIVEGGLNGVGDARFSCAALIISNFVIILGGGSVCLRFFPEFGSLGIWGCVALNRGVLAILVALRWRFGPWKKNFKE